MNDQFIGPPKGGDYMEDGLCEECMAGYPAKVYVMFVSGEFQEVFRTKFCPACSAILEAKFDEDNKKDPRTRLDRWALTCPSLYLKTDDDRLKREGKLAVAAPKKMDSRSFVETILARPFSERGIGLCGPVRCGKTRLMFSLLRRYYLEGKRVMYIYAPDFSDKYAGLMGDSPSEGNKYLESCINAQLWFLDDLGKGRLSEAAQRALLRVVEKRTNSERPIFVTCNDVAETLIDRMRYEETGGESEYASPMIERLKEFCDFFQLQEKTR